MLEEEYVKKKDFFSPSDGCQKYAELMTSF